ncbi:hypothetical protein [Ureaplasma zalophigenitalium]|uniref:Uncharacterized protein n=1 Tax=Ureaplasma zalophigenitalium TaxID=907723 RepID=A0ABT3BPY3_9BACT|nr:hypothetical protein [Ureaplasma zalophigenitalium]MCV3754258.1 hypothetical protein [Ureaplasma zalophigenitalium]
MQTNIKHLADAQNYKMNVKKQWMLVFNTFIIIVCVGAALGSIIVCTSDYSWETHHFHSGLSSQLYHWLIYVSFVSCVGPLIYLSQFFWLMMAKNKWYIALFPIFFINRIKSEVQGKKCFVTAVTILTFFLLVALTAYVASRIGGGKWITHIYDTIFCILFMVNFLWLMIDSGMLIKFENQRSKSAQANKIF